MAFRPATLAGPRQGRQLATRPAVVSFRPAPSAPVDPPLAMQFLAAAERPPEPVTAARTRPNAWTTDRRPLW